MTLYPFILYCFIMWVSLLKETQGRIALFLFLLLTAWWITLQYSSIQNDFFHEIFGVGYGIMAVFGGVCGLLVAQKWGGVYSVLGRALLMFSLGLFAQEFGQLSYFYDVFILHQEVPYPSLGDIGFFGSIPLYIYGVILLAKATGVKVVLKSFQNQILAFLIPVIMLSIGYFLFLQDYHFDYTEPLTFLLDFGYPLGQAVYISIAILTFFLTRGLLGGIMRPKVFLILFALVIQFLSDYVFLFQVSRGIWVPNGINDLMYLFSYFVMAIGLISFRNISKEE